MKLSNPFGRKVNREFVIGIKNSSIPYPESSTRWKTYGSPLSSIFNPYFDEIVIAYFEDAHNHLDRIVAACFKSRFKCKQSEDDEVNARLFRLSNKTVKDFFMQFNAEAEIIGVHPVTKSMMEYTAESVHKGICVEDSKPTIVATPEGKEELAVALNIKFDPTDMDEESMTIQRVEDGRYYIGYISKSTGKRRYAVVPENLSEELLGIIKKHNE